LKKIYGYIGNKGGIMLLQFVKYVWILGNNLTITGKLIF
jgi:hypothetical protein